MLKYLRRADKKPRLTDDQQVDKNYKYWRIRILYSMYIGYATFYLTRKSFTFAMPAMIHTLHFTKADIGILGSVFYITYGVSKFLSGIVADKSNPRYFMAIGLIITGIANILFGFSSSIMMLMIFWLINGFFQGWGWPPCARLLTHWYSQRERGVWWGIWNTSHNVGGAIIPIIAAVAATYWGWRSAMFIPGIIAIVMGFVLLNRLRDVPESQGLPPIEEYKDDYPDGKKVASKELSSKELLVKYVLCNKYIWLLAASYVLVYIVRTAINDWGALYLNEQGSSILSSDGTLAFFEIGGFCGSLVAGWMSDKIFAGRRGPVNVLFAIGIVVALAAFWACPRGSFVLHAACLYAIGFLVFGPQMLIGMAAAELSHREAAGTATGFVGLFGYIGAALSGYPIGVITQDYGWPGFFITVGICALLTIVLLSFLWGAKTHPQYLDKDTDDKTGLDDAIVVEG
ncbi:MAG: MFS transporter family glucose-6-phosphate receptor UhpC [Gammaproteobacteria bacterium]|nr:MFS transporter family glucose-6-phosphate receptor UhpC [Gammaproteobacteria bacterium]